MNLRRATSPDSIESHTSPVQPHSHSHDDTQYHNQIDSQAPNTPAPPHQLARRARRKEKNKSARRTLASEPRMPRCVGLDPPLRKEAGDQYPCTDRAKQASGSSSHRDCRGGHGCRSGGRVGRCGGLLLVRILWILCSRIRTTFFATNVGEIVGVKRVTGQNSQA